ncbi:MAG TPA: tetratricopeptide repeat protein, partial [Bacillota bacterium]|nr:tetratricopeptide repeat protein [Bacillota bacterium]
MNKNAEIIWVPKRPCSGNPPIRLRMAAVILLIAASIALSGCLSGTQPTTAEGWLDRGGKSLRDLDYEQAIAAFKKAIEIEPQNIPARISLAKAYADSKRPGDAE